MFSVLSSLDDHMNDDLNTARVLAGLFELVPVINSIKDGHIAKDALTTATMLMMKEKFNIYLVDIFGLKEERKQDDQKLSAVLQLVAEIRKDARAKKIMPHPTRSVTSCWRRGFSSRMRRTGSELGIGIIFPFGLLQFLP